MAHAVIPGQIDYLHSKKVPRKCRTFRSSLRRLVGYENQTKDVSFEKRSRNIYFLVENFLYTIRKLRICVLPCCD